MFADAEATEASANSDVAEAPEASANSSVAEAHAASAKSDNGEKPKKTRAGAKDLEEERVKVWGKLAEDPKTNLQGLAYDLGIPYDRVLTLSEELKTKDDKIVFLPENKVMPQIMRKHNLAKGAMFKVEFEDHRTIVSHYGKG
jgi:hypothetical protein